MFLPPLRTTRTYRFALWHGAAVYVLTFIQVNQKRASLRKSQCGYVTFDCTNSRKLKKKHNDDQTQCACVRID